MQVAAKREGWQSRPRSGRGGGFEYPILALPADIRQTIALAASADERENLPVILEAATPAVRQSPAVSLAHLTAGERDTVLARKALIDAVCNFETAGSTRRAAILTLVEAYQNGTLPQNLMEAAHTANARRGTSRGLSIRALYHWYAAYEQEGILGLVPANPQKNLALPEWLDVFLRLWKRPQNPSLNQAYREFQLIIQWIGRGKPDESLRLPAFTGLERVKTCPALPSLEPFAFGQSPAPSLDAIRRWLKKLPAETLARGRATGNALRKVQPHRRRSTASMFPGEGYTGDGTTFDALVQHPYEPKSFRPEITLILDVATRKCVGASTSVSESGLTVLDAFRMACITHGIPQFFYTDNGPGYRNAMLSKEGTGVLTLLGVICKYSIPGRPQGKGLMERAVKTIHDDLAKRFASCVHRDMDADTGRKFRLTVKKDIEKSGKSSLLPTYDQFFSALQFRIEEYNATPHSSLPIFTDASGKRRHYSPNEYWEAKLAENPEYSILKVAPGLESDLFMPVAQRPTMNGWVKFAKREYWAAELRPYHGQDVYVRYDMHDPRRIVVQTLDMVKICEAFADSNTADYRIMLSEAEKKAGISQRNKLVRAQKSLQKDFPGAVIVQPNRPLELSANVVDSLRPFDGAIDIEALPAIETNFPDETEDSLTRSVRPGTTRPVFEFPYQRYEWLMTHRDVWTEEDREWVEWYVQTEEYADYLDIFASKGIAWEEASCAKCS